MSSIFKDLLEKIEIIYDKRTGGKNAIKGFDYQMKYSILRMLREFKDIDLSKDIKFNLEGLEDIDIKLANNKNLIQVKNTDNLDINNLLSNFLKVYFEDNSFQFELVYSGKIPFVLKDIEKNKLDKLDKKINEIKINESTYNWTNFSLKHFASKIKLEKKLEADIEKEIKNLLVEKYNIKKSSETLMIYFT